MPPASSAPDTGAGRWTDTATETGTEPLPCEPAWSWSANKDTPLVGRLSLCTEEPSTVTVETSVQGDRWSHTFVEEATAHQLTVLGFLPGQAHELRVTPSAGPSFTLQVTAPELPPKFPELHVTIDEPDREPGYTILDVGDEKDGDDFIVALDAKGRVVWFHRPRTAVAKVERLQSGHLAYVTNAFHVTEVNMEGTLQRQWHARWAPTQAPPGSILVNAGALHHDVLELPNGHLLFIDTHPSDDLYPVFEHIKGPLYPQRVMRDEVIEVVPSTGEVVGRWPIAEMISRRRIGLDSVKGGWWSSIIQDPQLRDWTHANGLFYNPANDSILISLRHQDAVIAFSRATGAVDWIVAPEANWNTSVREKVLRPLTPDTPAYHQHHPTLAANGDLMFFDNHNNGASAYERTKSPFLIHSRAVRYRLDPALGTKEQVWSFTLMGNNFSEALGSVAELPETGNVLVTFGYLNDLNLDRYAIITEVTPTTPSEQVFAIRAEAEVFRAQHWTSLYVQ